MIQKIEGNLWEEFKQEVESLESKKQSFVLSDLKAGEHKDFWDKFLSEKFPEGSLNKVLEKNLAIYILKNKIDVEAIKEKYKVQKWSAGGLLGWIKKVQEGEILEYNTGELVNWAKENKPEMVELLVTKNKAPTDKERLKGVGIGNTLKFLNMKELNEFEEGEGGEIVNKLIPRGSIGAWAGKRASFKSWMGLSCALSIASGVEFCGFKTEKSAVAYFDRENGFLELKKRVQMLQKGLGVEDAGEIYFLGDYFKMDHTDHLLQIEEFIKERKIKVIFIDVYRRSISFDENDANKVSEFFVDRIKPLCERTGVSIVFLHHEKKGDSPDEMDNLRGSSDLVNYLDFVLLNRRRGNKIILKQLKSRRSKEIEPIDISMETDETTYFKFESLGTSTNITEPEKCAREVLKYLIETGKKEITFTEFKIKADSFGFPESTAKLSLKSLQERGVLEKGSGKFSPYQIHLNSLNLEDYFK